MRHAERTLAAAAAFAYRTGGSWAAPTCGRWWTWPATCTHGSGWWTRTAGRWWSAGRPSAAAPGPRTCARSGWGRRRWGTLVLTFPRGVTPADVAQLREHLVEAAIGVGVAGGAARRVGGGGGGPTPHPAHPGLTAAVHAVNDGATDVRVGDLSPRPSCRSWAPGSTPWRRPSTARTACARPWWRTWPTSCARRSRCSRRAARPWWTGWRRPRGRSPLHAPAGAPAGAADRRPGRLTSAESAGLRLVRTPVALDEVVLEVAESMRPRFDEGGVALTTSLAPATVLGDRERLHQVMTNLLVNAAKFTPAGGSVRVTVAPGGRGGGAGVGHRHRDRAPGAAAHLRPVLARHGQRRAPGSGVGLAIASELANAHGGRMAAATSRARAPR